MENIFNKNKVNIFWEFKMKYILYLASFCFTKFSFCQMVEVNGYLKLNNVNFSNANLVLVTNSNGIIQTQSIDTFHNLPEGSNIMSEIKNNNQLLSNGYTNTGHLNLNIFLPCPTNIKCGDWLDELNSDKAPFNRVGHSTIWTGSEMIVWGGQNGSYPVFNDGGSFHRANNSWKNISLINAPSKRKNHTAVWTGNEMIVWGGGETVSSSSSMILTNSGAKYNPNSDSWEATNLNNSPSSRRLHTAIWTGSEMIIWGGYSSTYNYLSDGFKYDPTTNSWTSITNINAPQARRLHTAIWTGTEMIIWGGHGNGGFLNSGAKYNPTTDTWTPISMVNAPSIRVEHTAIWTGTEMIIWGGNNLLSGFNPNNNGAKYNPITDTWTPLSNMNAPVPRSLHSAVWTGSEMIVWGGRDSQEILDSGGKYNPINNEWTTTSTANVPYKRAEHSAIWTGSEMIIWGGNTGEAPDVNSDVGKIFNPNHSGYFTSPIKKLYIYEK